MSEFHPTQMEEGMYALTHKHCSICHNISKLIYCFYGVILDSLQENLS